jgi:hypothetical protein
MPASRKPQPKECERSGLVVCGKQIEDYVARARLAEMMRMLSPRYV